MTSRPTILVWSLALAAVWGASARAADDQVEVVAEPGETVNAPHLVDLGANFDANLFEQHGNGWVLRGGPVPGQPLSPAESPALERGRELGQRRLGRIEATCSLSPDQRQRLRLAIESDVRRLAAEITEVRAKYQGLMVNMNDQAGQKKWHEFQQDVQRCREQLQKLFEEDSLFDTVIASTLDGRQRASLEAELSGRRSFRWRTMVSEALVRLDETVGLGQRQHEAIEALLLDREPKLRMDDSSTVRDDPNLRYQVVLMVLSGTDPAAVKEAVSDRQWRTLSMLMNQGRAMRSFLEQQGIIEGRRR